MSNTQTKQPLSESQIPVRWGDMDAYGHVNNAVYIRYLEEARVHCLQKIGAEVDGNGTDPVVINVGCTFFKPVTYPATLIIKCFVGEIGRSSFMINYAVTTTEDTEQLCSEGYSKVVWMDHNTGRSVPLPEHIRNSITADT